MYNLFFPATLSGFKPKLKTPKKGVFWSHWLANCVLRIMPRHYKHNGEMDHLEKRNQDETVNIF